MADLVAEEDMLVTAWCSARSERVLLIDFVRNADCALAGMGCGCECLLLHENWHLTDSTVCLLQQEWGGSMEYRQQRLRRSCANLPCVVVMASGDRVVGHAEVLPFKSDPCCAMLLAVVVCPELRGKGLGRALVAAVEALCLRAQRIKLYLFTDSSEGFYERLGFCRTSPIPDWRAGGGKAALLPASTHSSPIPPPTTAPSAATSSPSPSSPPPAPSPPPPAPPPPSLSQPVTRRVWMTKSL